MYYNIVYVYEVVAHIENISLFPSVFFWIYEFDVAKYRSGPPSSETNTFEEQSLT